MVCGNGAESSAPVSRRLASIDAYLRVAGRPRRMDALEALHEEIRAHGGCGFEICEQATQLVPGEGNATADVMLVGEAPGASEDKQGPLPEGRAGQLLDELLGEAPPARAEVYITNVVMRRPPGNRDPKADTVRPHLPSVEQ